MPRKTLIGISLLALFIVLILYLLRRNDGMTIVQRDIAESLERAKRLKVKRDSVARLEEGKRFPKTGETGASTGSATGEETGASTGSATGGETGASTGSATGAVKSANKTAAITDKPSANEGEFVGPPAPVNPVPKPESKEQKSASIQKSGGSASVPAERFFTTAAMDGLSPQGKQSVFKPGQQVFIYAGIHAPQAEQVRLEWIDPLGKVLPPPEYVNIQSNTGINGYRIYKQRQFQKAGKYEVRLYNGAGEMIGKAEFTVSEDF